MHWSPLTRKGTEVLNVAGHVVPSEKHPGSLSQGLTRVQISTMSVKDNLVVAGGFQGELICKYLDRPGDCPLGSWFFADQLLNIIGCLSSLLFSL